MLHHVSDNPEYASLAPYCITKKKFIQLLDHLDAHNIQTITFEDIIAQNAAAKSKAKKVILTFDDCYKHLIDFAIPELIKRNHKASFYMPTANIGTYNTWDADNGLAKVEIMNRQDLVELNNIGMEVGGHSHNHIKLASQPSDVVEEEIKRCKEILEDILNKKINSFAYPFGSVPANYKYILKKYGFDYGLSIYQPFENNFALRRFIFHNGDTNKTIEQKLSVAYKLYRVVTDPLK